MSAQLYLTGILAFELAYIAWTPTAGWPRFLWGILFSAWLAIGLVALTFRWAMTATQRELLRGGGHAILTAEGRERLKRLQTWHPQSKAEPVPPAEDS
jgi:hypothetical protein